jgi:opacity protein-like surface antigen
MVKFKSYALLGALALASTLMTGAVQAADMPMKGHPMVTKAPVAPAEEFGSGWYLRGDVGGSMYNNPHSVYGTSASAPAVILFLEDQKSAFNLGAGVGYKYNFLRTDVTVDYRFKSKYTGSTPGSGSGCLGGGVCSNEYAKYSSLAVLWNVYFDIGTWSGFTPYVGVGIGGAGNTISNWTSTTTATAIINRTKWDFAYALMAGASYNFSPNWALDAGYRFVSFGKPQSGKDGTTPNYIFMNNYQAHEFRVGVRYLID